VEHITMMIYLVSYHDIPFCNQYCCSVSLRKHGGKLTFSIESDIIELNSRKCLCRSWVYLSFLRMQESSGIWLPWIPGQARDDRNGRMILPCNHTNPSS
jgi:hypothetical protein